MQGRGHDHEARETWYQDKLTSACNATDPNPHLVFTEPHSDGTRLPKDAIPPSQLSPSLHHPPPVQVCSCVMNWTGKTAYVLIFFPRLIWTQSVVQFAHHMTAHMPVPAQRGESMQGQHLPFGSSSSKAELRLSYSHTTVIHVTNLCVHRHKCFSQ